MCEDGQTLGMHYVDSPLHASMEMEINGKGVILLFCGRVVPVFPASNYINSS